MSRGPGSTLLPPTPGLRKPAARSLSCLSDLDPRPCRAPGCDPRLQPIAQRRARSLPTAQLPGAPRQCCRSPGRCMQSRLQPAAPRALRRRPGPAADAGQGVQHQGGPICASARAVAFGHRLRPVLQQPGPGVHSAVPGPRLPPPIEVPGFEEGLAWQFLCLERVTCSDQGINDTVCVQNVAFEKHLAVRYTFSGWRSAHEAVAGWRGSAGNEGTEDVFAFGFPVPPFLLELGSQVLFALRYRVAGAEYWDNNDGRDYGLTCCHHDLRMTRGECEESRIHFI